MMRRSLLLALLGTSKGERIPIDEGELNRFADAYNAYVMRLKEGVIDTRRWKRVVAAWHSLTDGN